jgi:hypothetical protein
MSVINTVLRDLDRKPSAFKPLDVGSLSSPVKTIKNNLGYWVIALLMVVTVIVVYFLGVQQEQVKVTEQATPAAKVTPDKAPQISTTTVLPQNASSNETPQMNAALPERQITGLQIRENEAYMELEFQMTEFAPSYLKQRTNNRYVFIVRDVKNSIVTPLISDSPWLRQIKLSSVDDGVEISFDTRPGVLVDTQERQDDSGYYWQIKLKKKIEAKPISTVHDVATRSQPVEKMQSQQKQSSAKNEQEIAPEKIEEPKQVKLQIKPVVSKSGAQQKLNAAIKDAEAAQYDSAAAGFNALLDGDLDYQARLHLLDLHSQQNNAAEFAKLLSTSLAKYPNDDALMLYDANQLFANRQYLALIEKYRSQTDNIRMLSLIATSYQRTDQHQLAAEYYLLALKMNPQQPRLWISLAISQQNLSQREQALKSYQLALRSGPVNQRLQDFVQSKIKQLSN